MIKKEIIIHFRTAPKISDTQDESYGDKVRIGENGRNEVVSGEYRYIKDEESAWREKFFESDDISAYDEPYEP